MKIKLLENDKIIEVPNYWKWHLVEGKKVIIDQNKKQLLQLQKNNLKKFINIVDCQLLTRYNIIKKVKQHN